MTQIAELLRTAKNSGIQLWLEQGEKLKFKAPKDGLSPELKQQLSANKASIIAFLQETETEIALSDEHRFPLSCGQQALWFVHQDAPDSAAYNMAFALKIKGDVDSDKLQHSLEIVVQRHSQLRTFFESGEDGQIFQKAANISPKLQCTDVRQLSWDQLKKKVYHFTQQPFDLTKSGLRTGLFHHTDNTHVLVFVLHHILGDGRSLSVIQHEWLAMYAAEMTGKIANLPALEKSYFHYVRDEQKLLNNTHGQQLAEYWEKALSGEIPTLNLPVDYPRPRVQTFNGDSHAFELTPALSAKLVRLAKNQKVSLFTLLLAAFQILLHRYTGQNDIWVGAPASAGRLNPEFDQIVGYFVNPIVLRGTLDSGSFTQYLKTCNEQVISSLAHQAYPFSKLVQQLQPQRDSSRTPLFQTLFSFHAKELHASEVVDSILQYESFNIPQMESQFDLTLIVEESNNFRCSLNYNADLFAEETIERMKGHLTNLLTSIVNAPDKNIHQLSILTTKEVHQLQSWNDTAVDYQQDKTLVDLFEEQVQRTPTNTALIFNNQSLTYQELNEKANQLARYLLSLPQPDSDNNLVAIAVERSLEMVIGLLAILKSGSAYVPIDPHYPATRIQYMLSDCAASTILTQSTVKDSLELEKYEKGYNVVCLDQQHFDLYTIENLELTPDTNDLAYVIYTSGSTGKPKGVMNTHQGIVNRLLWMQETYQLSENDCILQKTPFSFDVSVWEFFWPLLTGARLAIAKPEGHKDPAYLTSAIEKHEVTTLHFVPSMLQVFLNHTDLERCSSLRNVICSGEALNFKLIRQFYDGFASFSTKLHNLYGPTEAAIDVSHWPCEPKTDAINVPIGKPVANTRLYVVDSVGNLAPVGVAGELYIGGTQVARGYLNRPHLTAEKFVDINLTGKRERVYKTGDLARWLPDGNVEYLGRIDSQVKINGFRIELGEIETALQQHPKIKQNVVSTWTGKSGQKRLVAYLLPMGDVEFPSREELQSFLKQTLPDYMVPTSFVSISHIPLSVNGKVDYHSLPSPPENNPPNTLNHLAPTTPEEVFIASIWQDILKIEKISTDDNFFAIGGDSILSIRVIARLKKAGYSISISDIFSYPTIAKLSQQLDGQKSKVFAEPTTTPFCLLTEDDKVKLPEGLEDAYPLAALQAGMVFHSQYETNSTMYHDVFSYYLRLPYDINQLKNELQSLVEKHPILRTSFNFQDFHEPLQLVHHQVKITIAEKDIQSLAVSEQEAEIDAFIHSEKHIPYNWEEAPLFRVNIHRRKHDALNLTFSFHHSILDGWSVASLMSELLANYLENIQNTKGLKRTQKDETPESYRNFIALEKEAIVNKETQNFWKQQMEDSSVTRLSRLPEPYRTDASSNEYDLEISDELSNSIKDLSKSLDVSIKAVLLTAHLQVMHLFSGSTDVTTGLVSNGRLETEEGEKTLGLFLNTLPYRLKLHSTETWKQLIQRVFKQENAILPHRRFPLHEIQKFTNHSALFETAFDFIHFHVYEDILKNKNLELLDFKGYEETNFVLTCTTSLNIETNAIQIGLHYDPSVLGRNQIEQMASYYQNILKVMTEQPERMLESSCLLFDSEIQTLQTWNNSTRDFPDNHNTIQLFEYQTANNPSKVALVNGSESLTYKQLNEKSNQIAHYLIQLKRKNNLPDNALVAILSERSTDIMTSVLATLKSGSAYLPVDLNYPISRIQYMLEDSAAPILLTKHSIKTKLGLNLSTSTCEIVCIDDAPTEIQFKTNPEVNHKSDDLAYVIYTSGSTGNSKGVEITHSNLVNAYYGWDSAYHLDTLHSHLQMASFSFDVFTGDWVRALCSGAKLVLCPRDYLLAPDKLFALIESERVDFAEFVPTVLRLLTSYLEDNNQKLDISLIIAGSELWYLNEYNTLKNYCSQSTRLVSGYGVTEATIDSSYFETTDPTRLNSNLPVPIGQPFDNTKLWVMDSEMQPLPPHVAGELCITGKGVARGYLNRPELTAERFIETDIFGSQERLYKTGDLARWLPDGNLEYLGRIDHQVKLRGFRIELGEIETLLSQHKEVKEAIVILYEDEHNKTLAAYATSHRQLKNDKHELVAELRTWLKNSLPEYMIPSHIQLCDNFALTPNGKIDRRALPAPKVQSLQKNNVLPRNAIELQLLGIWQTVLHVSSLGIHSNFFDLGGNSLLAVQLISHIQKQWNIHLPVRTLFNNPTIATLAEVLNDDNIPAQSHIVPIQTLVNKKPIYGLSGAIGSIMYLYPLASHLKFPFYALDTPDTDCISSIQSLAQYHLQALLEQQPTGPYSLIGHSAGGQVAFEMALQLEQQGEEIAFLGIIDTNAPHINQPRFSSDCTELNTLSDIVLILEEFSGKALDFPLNNFQQTNINIESAYQYVMSMLIKQEVLFVSDTSITELKKLVDGYRALTKALDHYQPKGKLLCPIHFFRATDNNQFCKINNDETSNWKKHTQATVVEHYIPGTHITMMTTPAVSTLATTINHLMDNSSC